MCAANRFARNDGKPVSSVTSSWPARGTLQTVEERGVGREHAGGGVELEPRLVLTILAVREEDRRAFAARRRRFGELGGIDEQGKRQGRAEPLERSGQERNLRQGLAVVRLLKSSEGALRILAGGSGEDVFADGPDDVERVVLRGSVAVVAE